MPKSWVQVVDNHVSLSVQVGVFTHNLESIVNSWGQNSLFVRMLCGGYATSFPQPKKLFNLFF